MTQMRSRKFVTQALVGLFVIAAASGCRQTVIDHAAFSLSDDSQTLSVSLVFSESVQSTLSGVFPIKDYGAVFVTPYSETQPFTLGFSLKAAVLNDQDFISLNPTSYLPNGMPIGIEYPLIEIRAKKPVHPRFDLTGYIDLVAASWFGAAATFDFITDQVFPAGTAVSGVFAVDAQGRPALFADLFGPALNTDGTVKRPGGMALFANVKRLKAISDSQGGGVIEIRPDKNTRYKIRGEHAAEYQGNPEALQELQRRFVEGLML